MRYNNFDKKVRFTSFFPYGYISPLALEVTLSCPENVPSYVEYDPNMTMEERERLCHAEHVNRLVRLHVMEQYGYVEAVVRKYGRQSYEHIRIMRFTQSGFNLISGVLDDDVERQRLASVYSEKSRKVKNNSYLPQDETVMEMLSRLNFLASYDQATTEELDEFRRLLFTMIREGDLTPLSLNLPIARTVNASCAIKGHVLYRGWKEMNVNALFAANDFLTQRDRRPLKCYRPVVDIRSDKWVANIQDYAFTTISEWYQDNPDAYLFKAPYEKPGDEWDTTPAFYGRSELPGFSEKPTAGEEDDENEKDNDTRYQTFTGLAIGTRTTYVVYHTKPVRTPWSPSVEENTIKALTQMLDDELEEYDIPGAKRDIKNAIMICPTIQQFGALFECALKRSKRNKTASTQVGSPYLSLCIIPLNHAGAMQLRILMLSSPHECESFAINKMLKLNNFVKTPDRTYKLSLNGIPVLVAHAMNFRQLYDAWIDYRKGKKFYVACYPEQAKYIRKIMPDVEFI